jgi:hypothetical protein
LLEQALRYKSDVDVLFIILINSDPNHVAEIEKHIKQGFEEGTVELISM